MSRKYTEKQLNYLRENYNKIPAQVIAAKFGITVGGLKSLVHRQGIKNPSQYANEWTQEEVDLLIANNKKGVQAIMKALPNRTRNAINAKRDYLLQNLDLFEHEELIPDEVAEILAGDPNNEGTYEECQRVQNELLSIGYSVEYSLDAELFNLHKMTPKERK